MGEQHLGKVEGEDGPSFQIGGCPAADGGLQEEAGGVVLTEVCVETSRGPLMISVTRLVERPVRRAI
ncbi:hypothetical protein [Kitasatospora brasiliensis]|uniref:hypothetical protein n=1 Tax=Kitasatospora brasiliensis TaxID=3058040 RepID=UPI002931D2D1|nr:hypothetical protein [Kitasatospora sp. K002]